MGVKPWGPGERFLLDGGVPAELTPLFALFPVDDFRFRRLLGVRFDSANIKILYLCECLLFNLVIY